MDFSIVDNYKIALTEVWPGRMLIFFGEKYWEMLASSHLPPYSQSWGCLDFPFFLSAFHIYCHRSVRQTEWRRCHLFPFELQKPRLRHPWLCEDMMTQASFLQLCPQDKMWILQMEEKQWVSKGQSLRRKWITSSPSIIQSQMEDFQ